MTTEEAETLGNEPAASTTERTDEVRPGRGIVLGVVSGLALGALAYRLGPSANAFLPDVVKSSWPLMTPLVVGFVTVHAAGARLRGWAARDVLLLPWTSALLCLLIAGLIAELTAPGMAFRLVRTTPVFFVVASLGGVFLWLASVGGLCAALVRRARS
jgi:hypothetical protein